VNTGTLTRALPAMPAPGDVLDLVDGEGRPVRLRVSSVDPGIVRGMTERGDLLVVLV